jgi:hypothetical protein
VEIEGLCESTEVDVSEDDGESRSALGLDGLVEGGRCASLSAILLIIPQDATLQSP